MEPDKSEKGNGTKTLTLLKMRPCFVLLWTIPIFSQGWLGQYRYFMHINRRLIKDSDQRPADAGNANRLDKADTARRIDRSFKCVIHSLT